MLKLLVIIALGAAGGGLLGSTRSCETGGCPLTATPLRGAIYGACLAALFGVSVVGMPGCQQEADAEGPHSPHLIIIESGDQFQREVLQADRPCLVDFYADWCGPCRKLGPVMNELADELAGRANVVKINVDAHADLAKKYGVRSIPDVRIFVRGEAVDQLVGRQPKRSYISRLETAAPEAMKKTPGADAGPAGNEEKKEPRDQTDNAKEKTAAKPTP
jgi:thioredoxin 1